MSIRCTAICLQGTGCQLGGWARGQHCENYEVSTGCDHWVVIQCQLPPSGVIPQHHGVSIAVAHWVVIDTGGHWVAISSVATGSALWILRGVHWVPTLGGHWVSLFSFTVPQRSLHGKGLSGSSERGERLKTFLILASKGRVLYTNLTMKFQMWRGRQLGK